MRRLPFFFSLALVGALFGCAEPDAAPPARHRRVAGAEPATTAGDETGATPPIASSPEDRSISRARLLPELDRGIGAFLGTVRVQGVLEQGRFVGFRIVRFHDTDGRYLHVDLAPGDVVTRVNGSPIERPEQALAVWNSLRVTSELCVEYTRNGERREIRYAIVD